MSKYLVIKWISLLAFGLFFCVSCQSREQNLISSLETLVSDVEKNKSEFTEKDWELTDKQMVQQLSEYKELRANFTDEERTRIDQLVGKYAGFRVKNAVNDFTHALQDFGEQFKGMLNEITDTTHK